MTTTISQPTSTLILGIPKRNMIPLPTPRCRHQILILNRISCFHRASTLTIKAKDKYLPVNFEATTQRDLWFCFCGSPSRAFRRCPPNFRFLDCVLVMRWRRSLLFVVKIWMLPRDEMLLVKGWTIKIQCLAVVNLVCYPLRSPISPFLLHFFPCSVADESVWNL